MASISACIISFNEERKIEACLQSLQGVVDEIIIVDSLSQDETINISKRYTDKIFHQAFLGHIEQKNFAVSKAKHTWILALDCDERLSPELRKSILSIKDSLNDYDAYKMPRKTYYIYRWLEHCWYPDRKIRLFNKERALWAGVNPHDRVEVDSNRINLLNGDIYHYSFDSISAHIQTLDKFSEIGAEQLIKKGKQYGVISAFSHASWTFIKIYFLRRGFLDGFAGIVVSVLSFVHVFSKYSKVVCYYKSKNKS
ncbi:MAG: glycosyltransferase family 2 protein [Thiohalomonadales bacterium]